ncbi:MAG: hypothetical protein KBT02_02475, partial [Treponema sp.]|nr:hypothetical protein [Candidatus Treponema caballi]
MNSWNSTYPRPSLKRDNNWIILNDGWLLNGKNITLPFPPESELSLFDGILDDGRGNGTFTYTRKFVIPDEAASCIEAGGHLLLHIGAVDQTCIVYADDDEVARSELGYFSIHADITKQAERALKDGKKELFLRVQGEDKLDHTKPWGKQKVDRGGMWYTPVSGIWQSVWCEWVSAEYIRGITYKVDAEPSSGKATVRFELDATPASVKARLMLPEGVYEFTFAGNSHELDLSSIVINGKKHAVQFWSAENPFLYTVEFEYGTDHVLSYFAVRTVSIGEDKGLKRIQINGKSVFLKGVLDQGYFHDGIFTPKSPDEYTKDIIRMKELGFNTLRKHIKVEPEIFYYECDRLGMYVLQDMINNGEYHFWKDTALATAGLKLDDRGRYPDAGKARWFMESAKKTQDFLFNRPCVVGYTVFNEGWGQTDSDAVGDELKERDSSRFYDYTSGWFAQKHSDVESLHVYFRTKKLKALGLPLLLSEFGGFTREVEGHIWNTEHSYGYGKCEDEKTLTDKIISTYEKMVLPAIPRGLCGAIYTQVSDIEDEINGFYTYDRQVCKVDKERISLFMKKLYI